jgi:hypothetical protein
MQSVLVASANAPPLEVATRILVFGLGLGFWYLVFKALKAVWRKAPDEVKSAATTAATAKAVGLIQKWLK